MSSQGYSDRISHAFAFLAKYYTPKTRRGSGLTYLTHPSNVAVILSRYACDEVTILSGILGHLVDEAEPASRVPLERKIGEKFGPLVLAVIRDVVEPRFDARGRERTWEVCKMDYLANIVAAEPRALEVCAANQIHLCGSMLADVRRLGVEYLSTFARASADQTIWWYRSVIGALEAQEAGPRAGMLAELRALTEQLARELEKKEEE